MLDTETLLTLELELVLVKIYFGCPSCDYPGRCDTPTPDHWQCPQCDHVQALESGKDEAVPSQCYFCGNAELYKKKDFPHSLGLTILTLACLTSTITYGLYDKWLTWTILIGSALFDGLLYLWVKDAIVCYRCNAHHRGIALGSEVRPFELTVHERYRQERIRREQLQAQQHSSSAPSP
jgi:hypothetical protein